MANLKDLVKSALEKKKQEHSTTGVKSGSGGGQKTVKDQVLSHKPAKKSAGRGR